MAAGEAWARLRRSGSRYSWSVRGRNGSLWRQVIERLCGRGCSHATRSASKWQTTNQVTLVHDHRDHDESEALADADTMAHMTRNYAIGGFAHAYR